MSISWYPGHMHKARKELGVLLRGARLVIEVLDARIPAASSNPLLAEMRGELPVIRILNKSDLADADLTIAWRRYFSRQQEHACLSSGKNAMLDQSLLLERIRRLAGGEKALQRGRIAITGIPNVGKSSLMNHFIGRKLARTGNTPSITRAQQRVNFSADWSLVDTPGMLRPRLEDQHAALLMACVGSIGPAATDNMEVALFLAGHLLSHHRECLDARYQLVETDTTPEALFGRIAVARGALKKAGRADIGKAAELLLQDYRSARLGRITLESPSGRETRLT